MWTFWYVVYRIALFCEARFVHIRDLAQRRKMVYIASVPEWWEAMRSW